MKKTRFTETQIVSILKQQEAGKSTREVCREHGIFQQTFLQLEEQVWGHGSFKRETHEGTGGRKCPARIVTYKKITQQYLDWFQHSNAPLPKENLFSNIKSD